ncbi:type II CRISPR-associated endonuclease Cas1 [Crocinitomicaceae bacterium]|nr:type II CRISPR-associated endonuclease Cas1 [Crocinitomicaceae bacterium]
MIKRTLHFGNPAYLNTKNEQLVVNFPEPLLDAKTVPIEDIGIIVLEHAQITISNALLSKLMLNNVVVATCNNHHLPISLMLPTQAHTEFNERLRSQLDASIPLRKNLWQQTIEKKIRNQAILLKEQTIDKEKIFQKLMDLSNSVNSGDTLNNEGQAAAIYWNNLFSLPYFTRGRKEEAPNNLLNYGYAILRAVCARSLIGSGLLPVWGIFHANKYNPYCLADDIMEPYRPFVDALVCDIIIGKDISAFEELTTDIKKQLLKIPALDVTIDGKKSPLMVAMSRTSSSLSDCFMGLSRKIIYPDYGK